MKHIRGIVKSDALLAACAMLPVFMDTAFYGWQGYAYLGLIPVLLLLAFLRRKKLPAMHILFAVYACWLVVTRLILGGLKDFTNVESDFQATVLRPVMGFGILCLGCLLTSEHRKKALGIFSFFYCGAMAALSLLAIYGSVTLKPLSVRGFYFVQIVVEKKVAYAQLLYAHRNSSAAWFMAAIFLLAAQWFACPKKWHRIAVVTAGILCFFGVSLQHCRSVGISTAAGLGGIVLALQLKRYDYRFSAKRIALLALSLVLTAAVSYGLQSACSDAVLAVSHRMTDTMQLRTIRLSDEPSVESTIDTDDNRDFVKDLTTLTARTGIWKSVLKTVSRSPRTLLLGSQESHMRKDLKKYGDTNRKIPHGHNTFIQGLYVSGVPGAAMQIAFYILLLIAMFRLYFSAGDMSGKCLVILLAGFMVYGMLEPLLTIHSAVATDLFLLTAGFVKAEEIERSKG